MIDLMQKNWDWGKFQPVGQFGEQCELALHTHVLVIQTQPKITVKLMSF